MNFHFNASVFCFDKVIILYLYQKTFDLIIIAQSSTMDINGFNDMRKTLAHLFELVEQI
jgi:hypothetical protein